MDLPKFFYECAAVSMSKKLLKSLISFRR